jgi:cephalosporin-C deacetylase
VEGFAAFWEGTFAANRAVPLRLELGESGLTHRSHRVRTVAFDALGGMRSGGWLLEPLHGKPESLLVTGHGYGGRENPDAFIPRRAAVLLPCAPGFHRSARADLPAVADAHVVHGIGHRDTYLIRFCVAALWSAGTALLELHPGLPLHYAGGSFGGGLGALALPWDRRFSAGFLEVPTFGHHPLRLQSRCNGSGEAVRRWHAVHPEVVEVLRFYDAAVAAARIPFPVVCAPALFDPAVPPPGQWAVANALPKGDIVPLSYGHFEHPVNAGEQAGLYRRVRALLGSGNPL